MTIYLDVLLLSNLWLDHAMLRTAAHLTHMPLSVPRGLLSAAIGAVSTLVILLPPMHPAVCILLRICIACCMSITAFRLRGIKRMLLQTALLFIISVFFCGVIYAASVLLTPVRSYLQNGVIYTDLSLTVLLIGSIAAAGITLLWERHRVQLPYRDFRLHLRIGNMDFMMPAIGDTGNSLRDVFTGKPVIVCTAETLHTWLHAYQDTVSAAQCCRGFRMLPVHTVTGMRLLPAFQPDCAALYSSTGQRPEYPLDVLIAVSETAGTSAIVPADCIPIT